MTGSSARGVIDARLQQAAAVRFAPDLRLHSYDTWATVDGWFDKSLKLALHLVKVHGPRHAMLDFWPRFFDATDGGVHHDDDTWRGVFQSHFGETVLCIYIPHP